MAQIIKCLRCKQMLPRSDSNPFYCQECNAVTLREALARRGFKTIQEFLSAPPSEVLELVRGLHLEETEVSPEDARALAASPRLAQLTSLSLKSCDVRPAVCRALAASPHAAGLKSLSLWGSSVGDEGVRELALSEHFRGLETLWLRNTGIGDAGAEALAAWPSLRQLREFDLGANRIGDAGARALAGSTVLAHVRKLSLDANRIGDAGAEAIASSPCVSGLTHLTVQCNRIGDAGALALASSAMLSQLETLDLNGNQVGDPGAGAFTNPDCLPCLRELSLGPEPLDLPVWRALRARFGRGFSGQAVVKEAGAPAHPSGQRAGRAVITVGGTSFCFWAGDIVRALWEAAASGSTPREEELERIREVEGRVNAGAGEVSVGCCSSYLLIDSLERFPVLWLDCGQCGERIERPGVQLYEDREAGRGERSDGKAIAVCRWNYPGNSGGKTVFCPRGHQLLDEMYWIC
jgi:hypothetical protein